MEQPDDTNAAIWKNDEIIRSRQERAGEREQKNAAQWRRLAELLPFGVDDAFTFADLGAGTGVAAREILVRYPRSTAILTDFSAPMIAAGTAELAAFDGRFRYVEFDMSSNTWPAAIPATLDAVVTSMCIHHMPDDRKQGLFSEIYDRLAPGAWYFNYDAISSDDPVVAAQWQHMHDQDDPASAVQRLHRTPVEQDRHANHVRYLIPLADQLEFLRSAGFTGIDVYWKNLDDVIYGGRRP